MIQDAIALLVGDEELTSEQIAEVANEILDGQATHCQIAGFITALRIRGEKVEHICAFTRALRARADRIETPGGIILDTVGTGGDCRGTFNISTAAALIAAAAGVQVAKHGNRAVSSLSGSADVLAHLGVNIEAPQRVVERCLREIGLCFLFAPAFHSAMRHAAIPRRELGIRSIFNMVGPLSNPAGATHQLIGVYAPELTVTFAEVLRELGSERALVVHGSDGLDEVTLTSVTQVTELNDGEIDTWTLTPGDFGLDPVNIEDLLADSPEASAEIVQNVLAGQKGPCAEIALANAGAALFVAGRTASIQDGYALAKEVLAEGKAAEKLEALVDLTNSKE